MTLFFMLMLLATPAPKHYQPALDRFVEHALTELPTVPGLAVTVVQHNQVLTAKGYGLLDRERRIAANADSRYYIASSTKSMTALAALMLRERGQLDFNRSLKEWFPDIAFDPAVPADRITLKHLLSHTAGIDNEAVGIRLAYTGQHDRKTLETLLAQTTVNEKHPLGQFDYTNLGYNITAMIIQRATGKTWKEQADTLIFKPLAMNNTSAHYLPGDAATHARPYRDSERLALEKHSAILHAAGGIWSTSNDMARWLQFQLGNGRLGDQQIVSAALINESRGALVDIDKRFGHYQRDHYAYGWYLGQHQDQAFLHHFGSFPGNRAHVSLMPQADLGVAVMVNDSGAGFMLADIIADYAYRLTQDEAAAEREGRAAVAKLKQKATAYAERRAADLAKRAQRQWQLSAPLATYAGTYDHPELGRLEITPTDKTLAFQLGMLGCKAEPFEKPETVRVEMIPGSGAVAQFEKTDQGVVALTLMGLKFVKQR